MKFPKTGMLAVLLLTLAMVGCAVIPEPSYPQSMGISFEWARNLGQNPEILL